MSTKQWRMPDTYVIIFFIVLLAALLTYVIPTGSFNVNYVVLDENELSIATIEDNMVQDVDINGTVYTIDATDESRTYVYLGEEEVGNIRKSKAAALELDGAVIVQEYGAFVSTGETKAIKIFEKWGDVGFLNYMFEGLVTGDKWGSAVGVVAFILVVGGAFGIILKTGAVDAGIINIITRYRKADIVLIPALFLAFSIGGAVFGMGEEAIPFAMIVVPLMISLGYDAVVGILITYGATQIGFATSWMNPFSVAIAQGIAGIQVGSGSVFRMVMWAIFTALGIAMTMIYGFKIKKNPQLSVAYETDHAYREEFSNKTIETNKMTFGHVLVLLTILLGIVWTIWGVQTHGYYIPEIATVFFTMGLVAGIIGVIFKLNNMTVNTIAESFKDGAKDLVGAALVVGMAQGIVLVLGHSSANTPSVLNTVLNAMANSLSGIPTALTAWFMYIMQSVFNFFVVSGSGQAALTMPLMAPLAELVGVSKQVAVLAFQLGDGFTNLIVPTSGCLMGVLGVARLDWNKWFKFQWKFQGVLFVVASIFMFVAVIIGWK